MTENKLEFIIKKDSAANDVELEGMSYEAAKAFSIIFNAVLNIIHLSDKREGVKIQIKPGSAVLVAEGSLEQIEEIQDSFNDIINFKSENKHLIKEWRSIQNLFLANGIQYEANIYLNDIKTSVFVPLKTGKKIRAKPVNTPLQSSLRFMTGKLIAVGGTNPNIHVEDPEGNRITIACTEKNARKANRFLYENIRISCWIKLYNKEEKIELCDSYFEDGEFNMLKSFHENFLATANEIDQLKLLHYKSRDFLDVKNYGHFRKFLRLYIHESTDVNILKTLLIVTQSFKTNDSLKEMREAMKIIFDKKIRIYNRKLANK